MPPRQGYIDLTLDSVPRSCRLWYRIVGDWPAISRPIVTLHGGPGFTHHYLLSMTDLADPPFNRTVVFFDQLGSGNSTHLPEKLNDHGFWTEDLFLCQVDSVLKFLAIEDNYDLIGHSWGGMLASAHAAKSTMGLKRLVLANTPVSSKSWLAAYLKYREEMPEPYRKILKVPRTVETSLEPDYLEAMNQFNKRHFISLDPSPSCLQQSYEALTVDRTVTLSTLGPDEFSYVGLMGSWSIIGRIANISCPTLVLNGRNEGANADSMIAWMYYLPSGNATYQTFPDSTHMPHLEERESFMKVVGTFLSS